MATHCKHCGVKLQEGQTEYCEDHNADDLADTYGVTLSVEVLNANALFEAALKYHVQNDDVTETEARELLMSDGDINIQACLQMLLDPGVSPDGTSILGSTCESV
jgi:hypothetical protein